MGIKSQREIAEQRINSHREPVNLYRGESPVRCIPLTAYILDWLLWHKNRKMGKKIFFEIFLKIMILKNLTSYEITIQAKLSLVPNSTALTFFLHSKGAKQTLAPQTGLFLSIMPFIFCRAVPFINDRLSKTMLYVQCPHILLKTEQCFHWSSFIQPSSTSLLLS